MPRKYPTLLIWLIIMIVPFISCDNSEFDSTREISMENLTAELHASSMILPVWPTNLTVTHLSALDPLAGARIIGLGEATHGTGEFFAMKHRIIRHLVEEFEFRVIAFESDFAETLAIDRYINGSGGNLDGLMSDNMHYFFWRTEEIRDLLLWMRRHNSGKPPQERIHYIGFDCQLMEKNCAELSNILKNIALPFLSQAKPMLMRWPVWITAPTR